MRGWRRGALGRGSRPWRAPVARWSPFAQGASSAPILIGAILLFVLILAFAPPRALASVTRFGSEGDGAGQFGREPTGIAIEAESGDVLIADTNNNRIDRFSAEGQFQRAWGFGVSDGTNALQLCEAAGPCVAGLAGAAGGQMNSPIGIAVDNNPGPTQGEVYVEDASNHRIERFQPNGEFVLTFGREVNKTAHEKGEVANENVCPVNPGDVCQAGKAGSAPGQFGSLGHNSIAVGPSGTVYVADNSRVQKFSPVGTLEGAAIALPPLGGIQGLLVDSTGNLYVMANAGTGVRKYDGTGKELGSPRDPTAGGLRSSIALGPGDELLVSDQEKGHVLAYDPSGTQTLSLVLPDASDVGGGVAVGNGALYVLYQHSPIHVLTLPPPGPVILEESEQASELLPTSAKLNASINPEGPQATKYHFEYGESEAYGQSTAQTALTPGFEDQAASAQIAGLQPDTTYHFRVVAENALAQTATGPDQTFTTAPPVSIESESASQVTATSAKLTTELNAHGLPSEFHFEYGTGTAYGQSAPVPDAEAGKSSQSASFSVAIQNLSPNTTYHYRVVAHNALGSSEGPDRTFTTQGVEASPLADDRAWEMVSPPKKHGVSLEAITREGGAIQAAADGSGLAYIALGPATGEPQGNRSSVPSELLSRRTAPGTWSTQDITTPRQGVVGVFPGSPSEYKLFSPDLARAALEPFGATPLSPQTSERTPYRREADGTFTPLVYPGNVAAGTKFGGEEIKPEAFVNGVAFLTATPDLTHLLVSSPTSLVEGFETPGGSGIYEWSGGTLAPVSILSDGTATGGFVGNAGSQMRGAISDDGTRVFFVGAADTNLYVRDTTLKETLRVDASEEGVKESEGGAKFQLASPDGQRVLFTDEQRLTKDATAKAGEPDLYECAIEVAGVELRCALHDLSVDPHLGEAASVQGAVLGASEDGRLVYFVARGALGEEGEGEEAKGGQCPNPAEGQCVNLYAYDTQSGQRHLVAVLSGEDRPDWNAGEDTDLGELTSRVSPDGRYLAFMSKRSLTGYDNRDAASGALDQEVYEYDSQSGKLSCASCDPTGQRPAGVFDEDEFPGLLVDRARLWGGQTLAGSIPGWTRVDFRFQKNAVYQSRYLSDSGRLFFNSPVGLVPGDGNASEDVYEYEPQGIGSCGAAPACLSLVSSGTSAEESAFLDASESGDDVFFLTAAQLSGEDEDNALDAYDAHVCSLAPGCAPPSSGSPPPCASADACRAAPTPQPGIFGAPASSTFSGAGNIAPTSAPPSAPKPKAKPPTRAQRLAKALAACRKKPTRGRAKCMKEARARYGPVHSAKKKGSSSAQKRKAAKSASRRGKS
jgi:sugar lactone lactonase YvrE